MRKFWRVLMIIVDIVIILAIIVGIWYVATKVGGGGGRFLDVGDIFRGA